MKQEILELRQQGLSYREIEAKLGCSKSTIAYHLNPNVKDKQTKRLHKRRKDFITLLKEEHGGCCKLCGYDKCFAALEFHHLDPTKKEMEISSGKISGMKKAREEADKCILVCSNCHREIHEGLRNGVLPR